jgi:hypothetical protein
VFYLIRSTGGIFHVPAAIFHSGRYSRMNRLNASLRSVPAMSWS